MISQRSNVNAGMTKFLAASGMLGESFTLLDVGASGGIDEVWQAFGDRLVAYGFDPLVSEVQRLNAAAGPCGKIEYVDAYIVSEDACGRLSSDMKNMVARSSAARAMELTGDDYTQRVFNSGAPVRLSDRAYSLDAFRAARGIEIVDFIKTDTDGFDYSALLGARETLSNRGVLGVAVEVQFNAERGPEANSLSNVDLYLRSLGFNLFDLDVYRYSKAALPDKFRYDIPAQTLRGQVVWGDAIYLRDYAHPDYGTRWPSFRPDATTLLKMTALFELFGLNDCAVELINDNEPEIATVVDPALLRQGLLAESHGESNYALWMQRFETYVKAGKYAAFPDDDVVMEQGLMLAKDDGSPVLFKKS